MPGSGCGAVCPIPSAQRPSRNSHIGTLQARRSGRVGLDDEFSLRLTECAFDLVSSESLLDDAQQTARRGPIRRAEQEERAPTSATNSLVSNASSADSEFGGSGDRERSFRSHQAPPMRIRCNDTP